MNSKGVVKLSLAAAVASAIGFAGSSVLADSAFNIESSDPGSGGGLTTWDNFSGAYPVVTAILTSPGSADGYTYKNYSFMAEDSSGSMDVFFPSTASTYVPTLGDAVSVSGQYAPFDGIPEMGTPSLSITLQSQGNVVPAMPVLSNLTPLNVSADNSMGLAGAYAGYYLQLDNVTLGNAGTAWGTHQNVTTTITDQFGNSMVLFLWASSYMNCGNIAASEGTAPLGPVDMTGFVDFFSSTSGGEAEFVPMSITTVPEPTTLSLAGIGSVLGGLFCYRFRRKA